MVDPVFIAGYLALFVAVGAVFLAVNLIVGRLVRPSMPNAEKLEVYECGEQAIGSSFVQFDLRFYVVALLFIIFEVEVALFFPWATVFGKATQLSDPGLASVVAVSRDVSDAAEGLAGGGRADRDAPADLSREPCASCLPARAALPQLHLRRDQRHPPARNRSRAAPRWRQ